MGWTQVPAEFLTKPAVQMQLGWVHLETQPAGTVNVVQDVWHPSSPHVENISFGPVHVRGAGSMDHGHEVYTFIMWYVKQATISCHLRQDAAVMQAPAEFLRKPVSQMQPETQGAVHPAGAAVAHVDWQALFPQFENTSLAAVQVTAVDWKNNAGSYLRSEFDKCT